MSATPLRGSLTRQPPIVNVPLAASYVDGYDVKFVVRCPPIH